jgi:hypothetical protein
VVRAEAPELFREEIAARLDPNPASLSTAIRDGLSTFEEAGGERGPTSDGLQMPLQRRGERR